MLTNGAIPCNLTTLCLGTTPLFQAARNSLMAGLVTASINARTTTTGYSATVNLGTATVTINAPNGTAAELNGTVVAVTQSGITIAPSPSALAGGSGGSASLGLTITALGDKVVQNPNFSGPNATTAPYNQKTITRHYGFGGTAGSVALIGADGVAHPLTNVGWSKLAITATVNASDLPPLCTVQQRGQTNVRCGELVITAANGKQSIDAITVTVGGSAPWIVAEQGVTAPSGKSVKDYGRTSAAWASARSRPRSTAPPRAT